MKKNKWDISSVKGNEKANQYSAFRDLSFDLELQYLQFSPSSIIGFVSRKLDF